MRDKKMTNIISYFNPFSKEHHALDDFKGLNRGEKFLTIVLTALATVASLPILGLGGVAAFRALSNKFTVIDLKKETTSASVETAKKTHSQFHEIFKTCSKDDALKILDQQPALDLNAKDSDGNTLIHIACMRKEFDEVIEKMLDKKEANFDARNKAHDLPILSYTKSHRNQTNVEIHRKMILKMNNPDFLKSEVLTNNDPDFLRKIIQKLDSLKHSYQLDAFTDSTELFVVLLERAETKEQVEAIVKYYQKDSQLDLPLDEQASLHKKVEDLRSSILENNKFNDDVKKSIIEKLKKLV